MAAETHVVVKEDISCIEIAVVNARLCLDILRGLDGESYGLFDDFLTFLFAFRLSIDEGLGLRQLGTGRSLNDHELRIRARVCAKSNKLSNLEMES